MSSDKGPSVLTKEEEDQLAPFIWVDGDTSVSVIMCDVGGYKYDVFQTREGFEGSGYDWGSLATVFLEEKLPALVGKVSMDPESSMFCAYSKDVEALKQFAFGFKAACEDRPLILDLFSRAEMD